MSDVAGRTGGGAALDWEYAPAPESRDVVSIAPEYGLFVDGEFAPAADGQTFATINPATEEPLAQVALNVYGEMMMSSSIEEDPKPIWRRGE